MKASYRRTATGYEIKVEGYKDHARPLYLRGVHNNKMRLYTDYLYAKGYSLRTAQKHVDNINNGIYI